VPIDGDKQWRGIERDVRVIVEQLVPENERTNFEFKADALFSGRKPFDKWKREDRIAVQKAFLQVIAEYKMPVIWGAVERAFYKAERGAEGVTLTTHNLVLEMTDVAFILCSAGTEAWLSGNADDSVGILIADENKRPGFKRKMKDSLAEYRRKHILPTVLHSRFDHFMDTLSFNNSAESLGLQIADHCAYFLKRRIMKKRDSDFLFEIIRKNIGDGYAVSKRERWFKAKRELGM
jgi:hypothetical protein